MSQVINICNGWACPLVTRCARSDFNMMDKLPSGCWVRHYQAEPVGDQCLDFMPIKTRGWGDGADPKN